MPLRDLEEKTGINKATLRRFALTLMDLSTHYLESLNLPDIAHRILEGISSTIKESANLAVLDGSEIVYVFRVSVVKRILGTNLRVGSRLPYYSTSLGKALVAWLPAEERRGIWGNIVVKAFTENTITDFNQLESNFEEYRTNGYAKGHDELEVGLRSIAISIFKAGAEEIKRLNRNPFD